MVAAPSKFNMAAFRGLRFTKRALNFSLLYGKNVVFPTITKARTYFRAPGGVDEESFEEMFRNSNFVKLRRPQGKLVAGKISHIVEHEDKTDLYVDFGWKFHAVFTLEKEQGSHYKVNDLVRIKLKELEATGHFLGQNRRVTLCEADANLEGKLNPDTTYRVLEKD